jgi:hypothetical protein
MDENVVREMLHELFTSLEALETQNSAITQFLKDKGITNEEELAPYLESAGNASNVRWLAARVRMDHLLSSAMKTPEKEPPKVTENSLEANAGSDRSDPKENKKDPESTEQAAAKSKAQSEEGGGTGEKNQNQEGQESRAVNKNAA